MQVRKRDIIAIANAGLGCVGRNHAMTDVVEQKSGQQMVARVPCRGSSSPLIRELLLDRIKKRAVHDRRLFAGQDLVFVFDVTDIKTIAQQVEQRTTAEGDAAPGSTRCKQS